MSNEKLLTVALVERLQRLIKDSSRAARFKQNWRHTRISRNVETMYPLWERLQLPYGVQISNLHSWNLGSINIPSHDYAQDLLKISAGQSPYEEKMKLRERLAILVPELMASPDEPRHELISGTTLEGVAPFEFESDAEPYDSLTLEWHDSKGWRGEVTAKDVNEFIQPLAEQWIDCLLSDDLQPIRNQYGFRRFPALTVSDPEVEQLEQLAVLKPIGRHSMEVPLEKVDFERARRERDDWLLKQFDPAAKNHPTYRTLADLLLGEVSKRHRWEPVGPSSVRDCLIRAWTRSQNRPWPFDLRGRGEADRARGTK